MQIHSYTMITKYISIIMRIFNDPALKITTINAYVSNVISTYINTDNLYLNMYVFTVSVLILIGRMGDSV